VIDPSSEQAWYFGGEAIGVRKGANPLIIA
jgi:hypothetical protein